MGFFLKQLHVHVGCGDARATFCWSFSTFLNVFNVYFK
jgi:hypothetical protein